MAYRPAFPALPELMTLALLEHARDRGLHDMSMRSMAAAMRTAPGTLTYHYGEKDEILAACARFLGRWLHRDIENRILERGLVGLMPEPDPDENSEEYEYRVRLRLWIQLTAYGLSSPCLAPEIAVANERLADLLTPFLGPEGVGTSEQVQTGLAMVSVLSDVRERTEEPSDGSDFGDSEGTPTVA